MAKAGDEIVVVAHFTAKQGKEGELLDLLHSLLEPTRKEAGCIRFELNQEVDNPRAFTFAEKFASREAFEAHTKTPHIARFRQQAEELLESREVRLHRELLPVSREEGTHA
ncbi:MAG: antibiotic biosynthesis monooxygenase [Acidobacteriia bacterium]|nr:antibiotic biosynthesis monooxygenase [Terriglobia bacterium]